MLAWYVPIANFRYGEDPEAAPAAEQSACCPPSYCVPWYGRALSSYGLLQGLTGVRYDAVSKTLYMDSRLGGDFRSFLSAASGFGTVGLKAGKPFVEMKAGTLAVEHVYVSGVEKEL